MLAGGGHSHALVLKQWAMRPHRRPEQEIILVNRNSTTLYSGMVPGLIAGLYERDELAIDLRALTERAGVAFAEAEITGVDPVEKLLHLEGRPSMHYSLLSLDVGAISRPSAKGVAIKPLEPALAYLAEQSADDEQPFRVIGAGAAGVEVVLALRERWPQRRLQLQEREGQLTGEILRILFRSGIELVNNNSSWAGPSLLCTGSRGPEWLKGSGLPVNRDGRVKTDNSLRVVGLEGIFACGDCAVIKGSNRPASGVWAVRAARPLADNLEASCRMGSLRNWKPQRSALQLIGNYQGEAWAKWWGWCSPATSHLWKTKQYIDKHFIQEFRTPVMTNEEQMACRGCAAKLAAVPLMSALKRVALDGQPEDAVEIFSENNCNLLQSVDGFPALVSDPWLNGRVTTLHACSDLWASGAVVSNAMATIVLPMTTNKVQQEWLVQTLGGIKSALKEQGAVLLGGHTMESRNIPQKPTSLGIEIALTINGKTNRVWSKSGIKKGDQLLLSRPLGTGILFAGTTKGETKAGEIDKAIKEMNRCQGYLLKHLKRKESSIHACTDITGYGLLGHLGEILQSHPEITVHLDCSRIPAYKGVMRLLKKGVRSTLAPQNRAAWRLIGTKVQFSKEPSIELMELLVDPQTCGPLLVACEEEAGNELIKTGDWTRIGYAK